MVCPICGQQITEFLTKSMVSTVASSFRLLAVALNASAVRCLWTPVSDVYQYTVFSCSGRLQDGLCQVNSIELSSIHMSSFFSGAFEDIYFYICSKCQILISDLYICIYFVCM